MAQINKSNEYFDTLTWTGDNSTRNITDLNFQPDLVWIKHRSFAFDHREFDSVRGANKSLATNTTSAEASPTDELTAFLSNGFTLGNSVTVNGTGYGSGNFVGWSWLGGGTASSNTDGSITSQVSANTTSGFSIATFTGNGTGSATIGHGLGVAPKFVIIKSRSLTGESWQTWFDNDKRLNLNSTSVSFISTHPISTSSTVVTTPSTVDNGWNTSSATYVMYSFAEKKGFSKFGSYTGNGSTDGTFIYTGMRPAFFMLKRTDSTSQWVLYDNKRQNNYNPQDERAYPNLSDAPGTGRNIDFLSNGIKLRDNATDSSAYNISGANYIYMCFSENPLVGTNNVVGCAR